MTDLIALRVPLVNANEAEAVFVSIAVVEGQAVSEGDLLATIETTKSTMEIYAEHKGFLVGLIAEIGKTMQTGQVWAYLGDSPDTQDVSLPPWVESTETPSKKLGKLGHVRITDPALKLVQKYNLDIESLSYEGLITTHIVEKFVTQQGLQSLQPTWKQAPSDERDRDLLIYGAGGHGRSLAEMIQLLNADELAGFVDDNFLIGEPVLGIPVLGGREDLKEIFGRGITLAVNGVGGISNPAIRLEVFSLLNDIGFYCPRVIHPKAFLEATAQLSDGVQVFPFAYVGSQTQIGFGSIINTGAIVSHDCILGELTNLSPGATLAGDVRVDDGALIGMRATINLGVSIGKGARIGNGATVKADVPDNGVVPAGAVWPLRG
ncbi:MAG: NeuD/PglB/VioB family sugar acetyltransferase [Anaerolineaceae bacterium]|nr:NeuD/PglB/VioB family sugar acetyltransferase [Anaerolineaceae bacterium]